MQASESVYIFRSDAKTDLQAALPLQASAYVNLTVGGANRGQLKGYITSVKIQSIQLLDWRIEFHSRRLSQASAPFYALGASWYNSLLGYVGFSNNAATAYGTSYLYYTQGLKIPYIDDDGLGELHLNVVNQHSATAKLPGDTGAIHVAVGFISGS